MFLVVVILIFFLYDFRAGLIVATTIPLALLFAFICLDLQHASANFFPSARWISAYWWMARW
jgi:cobalt-zinc-cadmium resistance protein CzcA